MMELANAGLVADEGLTEMEGRGLLLVRPSREGLMGPGPSIDDLVG